MKNEVAIKKMKEIEERISQLKKAGYNVFCVDNDSLVLESPTQYKKNIEECDKEQERNTKSRAWGYGTHFSPKCEYEYTISL